ncbi:hypothetical protein [Oscillibacter sp.]|uniref:hypothetical protein n=1 Tax=Oscillibacter sp. TaxID=1945593 RepID=UPI0028AD53A1|nr:hypothetical protein [Oscillibacter sp.]
MGQDIVQFYRQAITSLRPPIADKDTPQLRFHWNPPQTPTLLSLAKLVKLSLLYAATHVDRNRAAKVVITAVSDMFFVISILLCNQLQ